MEATKQETAMKIKAIVPKGQENPDNVQPMFIAVKNIQDEFHHFLRDKEIRKIHPEMIKVEDAFIAHLNQENLEHTYDQIFQHFNAEFLRCARYVTNKFKPKHVLVNPKYFEMKFKSKES